MKSKVLALMFFSLIYTLLTFKVSAAEITLNDCGAVIGHEMGLWEFFSYPPNPEQVDRVLKSDLKFVKISLRKLKDGVWVVNHDADVTISRTGEKKEKILLNQLTWKDVENLKSNPYSKIPIYRLEEYIQRDQKQLCWMLSPKDATDKNLVDLIVSLNLQHRSVLLTYGLTDAIFYSSFPKDLGLNFAGRVVSSEDQLEGYSPYLSRLWAMELDPTPRAKEMIIAIHKLGLRAYLDSMRYSKTYEIFGSACSKVFAMGADITQTNRPLACIKKMGL